MSKNVTVILPSAEVARMSLPAPIWEGSDNMGTGITLKAVYVSPRAKRCVIETYSIWASRNGTCVGTRYELIEDAHRLARLADANYKVAEALEKCGILKVEAL